MKNKEELFADCILHATKECEVVKLVEGKDWKREI